MHADDTNYTMIKNGVVVVSGTARQSASMVIGSSFATVLRRPRHSVLTRADASRKLQHIIMCGNSGGSSPSMPAMVA